jgi:hypothetical protein
MPLVRPANTRGNPRASWINSYRTFSFPGYYDARYLTFSHLQTLNDDRVQPNSHVPWHEHKNMEIIGYVIAGTCHHTDSLGHTYDLSAGCVQRMSAGRGIWHTEGNAGAQPNRYLQLWIKPNECETEPRHDWYYFTRADKLNTFCDLTAKLPIKQDAHVFAGIFNAPFTYSICPTRHYYLYMVTGTVCINEFDLIEGDGLSFAGETWIQINPTEETELILFDLSPAT